MLGIDDFEVTSVVSTVDFELKLSLMDQRFSIIEAFILDFPQYRFIELPPILNLRSVEGERAIAISVNRWEYTSRAFETIEDFASETETYLSSFGKITEINAFSKIGLRINYSYLLRDIECVPPEFPYLKAFLDIPGADDKRISDLIHYNVSVQREGKRRIFTIGQVREGETYFLRPTIEALEFGDISLNLVKEKLMNFYQLLQEDFEKFFRG